MSNTPDTAGQPGDLLVRVGAVVFAVGALATLATMAPLFLDTDPLPTPAYLVSMLMGAGFALAGAGMLRGVAAQRRAARRSADGGPAQGHRPAPD